jgi:hypothetical protein
MHGAVLLSAGVAEILNKIWLGASVWAAERIYKLRGIELLIDQTRQLQDNQLCRERMSAGGNDVGCPVFSQPEQEEGSRRPVIVQRREHESCR